MTADIVRSGKERRADFCPSHEDRCQRQDKLEEEFKPVRDEVITGRTEKLTKRRFYGSISTGLGIFIALLAWVMTDNLSMIRDELKTIKIAVAPLASNQEQINSIKDRLEKIETELQSKRK